MNHVSKRNDTKCPYCVHSEHNIISERKPKQIIVKCLNTNCNKYFMVFNGLQSYPLLDPADQNSLPGTIAKV